LLSRTSWRRGRAPRRCHSPLLKAELALTEGDPERTLSLVDRVIGDSLPPSTRAEAETLRHRALHALGRDEEAATALTLAALLFEEAGAYRRPLDAWRTQAGVPRADWVSR
jgi:hypothetical protein